MLKSIYIKNISSIGEMKLDLKKNSYKYKQDNVLNDVVNPVAIYGHNGSGKTSILRAIQYLEILLMRPIDQLAPFTVNNVLFEEYQKDHNEKNVQGTIAIEFDIQGKQYKYSITTSLLNRKITNEQLLLDNEEIISRNKNYYFYRGAKVEIGDSYLIPTLRKLANIEINDAELQAVYSYLSSFTVLELPRINSISGFVTSKMFETVSKFDLLVGKSLDVKKILKDYKEFPVYDIVKKKTGLPNEVISPEFQYEIEIEGNNNSKINLPYNMISSGMQNQSMLLSILLSMPSNSVLFIDELEQALHPSAIISFLDVIREKKVQTIFTSHNTHILQNLRPDQIYITKWDNGFSSCDRLSDIYPNIREINNIEKMYLSGVFDQ